MPTKNPEPLAAQLEELLPDWTCAHNAAATLRSQYAEIEALKASLTKFAGPQVTFTIFKGKVLGCDYRLSREDVRAARALLDGKDGT
jgi:hypothetical protein